MQDKNKNQFIDDLQALAERVALKTAVIEDISASLRVIVLL
jgi:hypothetical protein